jgi:hypothetical protein
MRGERGMNKPKYVIFYVEDGRIYGAFYDSEEELLERMVEDAEIFHEDIVGYTITQVELTYQGRIVFYAER